jgi:transcriptional regulator of acetoin/glycerol metabolism
MKSLREVEKNYIQYVLDKCDWNKMQSAKVLGIDRSTLYTKIKKYNLQKGRREVRE